MSRKNARRRDEPEAVRPVGAPEVVEEHPDGDWVVRRITGAASTKPYRCPGCDHEIRPATPHVVAWPAEVGSLEDRRHWHTACWSARDRRRPRR